MAVVIIMNESITCALDFAKFRSKWAEEDDDVWIRDDRYYMLEARGHICCGCYYNE